MSNIYNIQQDILSIFNELKQTIIYTEEGYGRC